MQWTLAIMTSILTIFNHNTDGALQLLSLGPAGELSTHGAQPAGTSNMNNTGTTKTVGTQ